MEQATKQKVADAKTNQKHFDNIINVAFDDDMKEFLELYEKARSGDEQAIELLDAIFIIKIQERLKLVKV